MLLPPCNGCGCRKKTSSRYREAQIQSQPTLTFLPPQLCRWPDNLTTMIVLTYICNTKLQEPVQRQEVNTVFLQPISLPKEYLPAFDFTIKSSLILHPWYENIKKSLLINCLTLFLLKSLPKLGVIIPLHGDQLPFPSVFFQLQFSFAGLIKCIR